MESIVIDLEKGRTSGDGMEDDLPEKTKIKVNEEESVPSSVQTQSNRSQEKSERRKKSASSKCSTHATNENVLPLPGLHALYRRNESVTRKLAPVIPRGELVPMKPRLVTPNVTLPDHKKTKPPKFVPYEPYPGAVNPMVATAQSGHCTPRKINKNNLDIGVLVSQMSTMRNQELEEVKDSTDKNKTKEITISNDELKNLKDELERIKGERDHFHSQFKFQTQVNTELKNLLVASVGEDLQTRVNVLTEDKLQLARALLDTANNLTTHTEQIEFLAGQCEVWRSKFLASSVMVEELARWKADLTQKNQMLNEATKMLLHSTHQLREIQLDILKNLKFLAKIRYLNLPAIDVISLSAENLNILQQMVLHSGVGMPDDNLNVSSANTSPLCESEKFAVQALQFLSQPLLATDEAIRALFDQAQRPYNSSASSVAQNPFVSAHQQHSTLEGNKN